MRTRSVLRSVCLGQRQLPATATSSIHRGRRKQGRSRGGGRSSNLRIRNNRGGRRKQRRELGSGRRAGAAGEAVCGSGKRDARGCRGTGAAVAGKRMGSPAKCRKQPDGLMRGNGSIVHASRANPCKRGAARPCRVPGRPGPTHRHPPASTGPTNRLQNTARRTPGSSGSPGPGHRRPGPRPSGHQAPHHQAGQARARRRRGSDPTRSQSRAEGAGERGSDRRRKRGRGGRRQHQRTGQRVLRGRTRGGAARATRRRILVLAPEGQAQPVSGFRRRGSSGRGHGRKRARAATEGSTLR
ncbi:hypothetical protein BRADI_3g43951v3 [Brachypodium distachyon]|uniref:Uncharacterized protein n=1 Tax=Brachypodium distachyon TaxID=15368 RepID=A0A0Q3FIV5_BRADI|nr:hypothetical protein BRADI_3g43951v3 [Brachypodium distachyon]PNT68665.1 hypothetical protein BRADI_3g43951v3 [Brachypodium distachyon]PNT68666.1 hypothetical protein BRADI_3g43951v3 [Brachypodium distachyon]PNT68667.1 hypothetical protein BRADI_3g43951v3 [Brachypodium distachyon]PNT68668.1 hypothetical protein BRADI_3g43951v3 [Brachypodium distachyon]